MKFNKEWFIPAPWGNIAALSYGDVAGEQVLLVHGRQDSAATFTPLLELMPDKYHYVVIDMPGNGRSDPFPISVKLSRFHFIAAVEHAVDHLEWEEFIYIAHSMGCEQGLFYNAIYPGRIKKLIFLDLRPSLQRLQRLEEPEHFKTYSDYYENYDRENKEKKVYSRADAVKAVMRARDFNEEQAELILSRNLMEVGEDRYVLSWDKRLFTAAPQNYPNEYYHKLFSRNSPPILNLRASEGSKKFYFMVNEAQDLLDKLAKTIKDMKMVDVIGGHDVHFTNPERCAKYIIDFMEFDYEKAKL